MGTVIWNKTAERKPTWYVDVLCYFKDIDEYHVMELGDDGEWRRQMDDDEPWAVPDYWAELPASPV